LENAKLYPSILLYCFRKRFMNAAKPLLIASSIRFQVDLVFDIAPILLFGSVDVAVLSIFMQGRAIVTL
jgi:hypothetical protein